jgi:hypothetical protein
VGTAKATVSKTTARARASDVGGALKTVPAAMQPNAQQGGMGCWWGSPVGSSAAPSCVQMTLPKASSCIGSGPLPKAKAPSADCSTSSQAATNATAMLPVLRRMLGKTDPLQFA